MVCPFATTWTRSALTTWGKVIASVAGIAMATIAFAAWLTRERDMAGQRSYGRVQSAASLASAPRFAGGHGPYSSLWKLVQTEAPSNEMPPDETLAFDTWPMTRPGDMLVCSVGKLVNVRRSITNG